MDFNKIYLPENIIYNIYENIPDELNVTFTHINNYTYTNFRNITKYKIFKFINTNYKLYKKYINIYQYDNQEINNIGLLSAINVPEINCVINNYYDLRYLFEALYKKSVINLDLVENKIVKYLISLIENCISFDRFQTIYKINNNIALYSLHYNFIPNEDEWIYI